jgi:hypothetical protein
MHLQVSFDDRHRRLTHIQITIETPDELSM